MDRIAVISDIHGNITALNTVIDDISKRGIKRIACLGDITGKGPNSDITVDIIKEKCEICVIGNVDYGIIENPKDTHRLWHKNKIGEKRIEYLKSLPIYVDLCISGSYIRMFHASKDDLRYRIFDDDSIEKKMSLFEEGTTRNPDVIIYGDIHTQYMQKFYNKTIINVGSVGNALEIKNHNDDIEDMQETTQAFYTILEGDFNSKEKSSFSIQFVRVPYDIQKEIEISRQSDMPDIEEYITELTKAKYRGKKSK